MSNKRTTIFLCHMLVCWLAIVNYNAYAEDELGRLFSRPIERKNLDYLRQNQPLKVVSPQEQLPQDNLVEMAPPELPDPITLQGYVKRSDGKKSTVWINGQPVDEDSEVDQVRIGRLGARGTRHGEGLEIKIPANGKQLRLKAGQVYDPETNQIKELKTLEKEKQLHLEETGEIVNDE